MAVHFKFFLIVFKVLRASGFRLHFYEPDPYFKEEFFVRMG